MKLAIGDIVQGRHEVALGTVAGITDHGDGRLVVVRMPGGGFASSTPATYRSSPAARRRPRPAAASRP
ncbi:hypothetical protein ACFQ2B_37350 [Streptomyces stramineus]